MIDASGWIDFGQGLYRKAHLYREGVAVCDSRDERGKRRSTNGGDLPATGNSCQRCLIIFAAGFDPE